MPLDTALSANGTIFANTNVVVDIGPDLYANNIYYRTLNGTSGPTNFGYTAGGGPTGGTSTGNVIDRFPFALAITNATDVGDLLAAGAMFAIQSSTTHGYQSTPRANDNVIQRFPFALSITNTADVGDLTAARDAGSGQSSSTHGYSSGGPAPAAGNVIDRFPFALSITNATDVGDTSKLVSDQSGLSSSQYGYWAAGRNTDGPAGANTIERFPFALSITNSTDVGDLTLGRWASSGCMSSTYGYVSGANPGTNVIDRFPFALSITNAADVGDLTTSIRDRLGSSSPNSTTFGYVTAGDSGPAVNIIERWPFALSITNATDVGDLTVARATAASNSY